MSSEIYELMKRVDEAAVVEKAHRRPALRRGLRARDDQRRRRGAAASCPTTRSSRRARRTSRRSTSTTSLAERHGTLGELRAELASGVQPPRHTTLREWLDA